MPFPEAYYATWRQIKDTRSYNSFDKMTSRLPPNVLFDNKSNCEFTQNQITPTRTL